MNQFTPGPWDLDEGDLKTVYDLETSEIIAEVFAPLPQGTTEDYGRLIAAAPELREALKACAAVLSGEAMSKKTLADALEAARAALAKAEGRA